LLYTHLAKIGVEIDEFSPLKLLKKRYELWHLHWPERFFNNKNLGTVLLKSTGLLGLIKLAKAKRIRIVWTVHNLKSHENFHPRLEAVFWRIFIPMVDGYINLSHTVHLFMQECFPMLKSKPGFVIPIGHFRDIYPNYLNQATAREILGIPSKDKVVLFIGFIRPYKNVLHLIIIFRKLNMTDLTLLIVGKPSSSELAREIVQASEGDPRIRLYLNFIPEDEIQLYLNATDLVVLPFQEIFNSASALLSLSFERPVLLPEKGSMGELKSLFGEDWVMTYNGELTSEILREGLNYFLNIPRPKRIPLESLDWTELAKETLKAYEEILKKSTF
jgi:glycosyltransferase involved in cell wall biosynthesis